jgi:hypothetical protein
LSRPESEFFDRIGRGLPFRVVQERYIRRSPIFDRRETFRTSAPVEGQPLAMPANYAYERPVLRARDLRQFELGDADPPQAVLPSIVKMPDRGRCLGAVAMGTQLSGARPRIDILFRASWSVIGASNVNRGEGWLASRQAHSRSSDLPQPAPRPGTTGYPALQSLWYDYLGERHDCCSPLKTKARHPSTSVTCDHVLTGLDDLTDEAQQMGTTNSVRCAGLP